ncbi:hypothetical protein [Microvirga sp. BSC39]|uniref:hypothetical protein n=1 Tax=Microvirga sp. BSC39 TaxID=1549810 RepID=UPI0004E8A7E9|nr:hypothetical protein [Microvirga sp. BSC39]KFG69723.1 hypothetical protein JH26_08630 [Microvirga sp. BSC39]
MTVPQGEGADRDNRCGILYGPGMSNETTEIRDQLSDQWQKVAIDLIRKGLPAETVFETLLTVGLAGQVELHGKHFMAGKLVAIAEQLSEQVRREKEALQEASTATKN